MSRLFKQFIPFIFAGVAIVAFAFGIMLLAYLFLFGAIIGLVLFIMTRIREKFFPSKAITKKTDQSTGRTFDANDWKKHD